MTVYKSIVKPVLNENGFVKIDDVQLGLPDYVCIGEIRLDRVYSEIYLKNIRFTLAYVLQGTHEVEGAFNHPYQVHLRWLDDHEVGFQPGEILQNTMYLDANGLIRNGSNYSRQKVNYSTFCQSVSEMVVTEPDIANTEHLQKGYYAGLMRWLFYDMERDALIRQGSFDYLRFEVFFTNLNGERLYRFLPNVEIEFQAY